MGTITYRKCNVCEQFASSDTVHRIQKYNKTRPIGGIICLCNRCLEEAKTKEPQLKYIKMGG